jgi:hypothetical protein
MTEFWDEPQGLELEELGPVFVAGLESECASCPEPIEPGERARADGHGGWIHADAQCERVARGEHTAMSAAGCPRCFTVHAGECL